MIEFLYQIWLSVRSNYHSTKFFPPFLVQMISLNLYLLYYVHVTYRVLQEQQIILTFSKHLTMTFPKLDWVYIAHSLFFRLSIVCLLVDHFGFIFIHGSVGLRLTGHNIWLWTLSFWNIYFRVKICLNTPLCQEFTLWYQEVKTNNSDVLLRLRDLQYKITKKKTSKNTKIIFGYASIILK